MNSTFCTGWAMTNEEYRACQQATKELPSGIYSINVDGYAKPYFQPVAFPSDHPVSLPGLPTDFILKQINEFWEAKDVYKGFNFLQKRGIMLYGPPGCGKTSVIRLVCDDMIARGGIIFLINNFGFAVTCLSKFREVEPDRPILTLMEDIEGLFAGDAGVRQVQLALSLLDGQDQLNNVVHIATTNKPEDLADRFIKRPGRFDLVIGIHAPSAETREAYLRHVGCNKIPEAKLKGLVAKTDGLGLSYLRELASSYLCLGVPLDETLERLRKNFTGKISNRNTGFTIGFSTSEDNY